MKGVSMNVAAFRNGCPAPRSWPAYSSLSTAASNAATMKTLSQKNLVSNAKCAVVGFL